MSRAWAIGLDKASPAAAAGTLAFTLGAADDDDDDDTADPLLPFRLELWRLDSFPPCMRMLLGGVDGGRRLSEAALGADLAYDCCCCCC